MSLARLQKCLRQDQRHVSPFLMLGDPTPEISFQLAATCIEAGASMLELGIPFSDPCADGPAIQRACQRARQQGTSTQTAFAIIQRIHLAYPDVPMNLLVYGNLVHAWGCEAFCKAAAQAGASSLLVPDIGLEEGSALEQACQQFGLGRVHLLGPLTPIERIRLLDESGSGFLYLAAHQGITGSQSAATDSQTELLQRVAQHAQLPLCLGFGLSKAQQLSQAFRAGASLCVIGSHLARSIEAAVDNHGLQDAEIICKELLLAFQPLLQAAAQPPSIS